MSDLGHKLTNNELAALEKRIFRIYAEASKEVGKAATEYFDKFKARDAQMLELVDAGKLSEEQYKQWRLAQIGRGEYFTTLRDKLAERMTQANEIAVGYVNDKTPSIYSINRNYSAYTIEQVSSKADFTLWNEQTIRRLAVEQPDLMPNYPKHLALKRGIDLEYGKQRITASVTSGILRGLSIPKLADDLQFTITNMNRASAIRTARTSVTSAQNAGRQDTYQAAVDMGISLKKEWIATLDDRTRTSHADIDGERVEYDKPFSNGLKYPGDRSGRPEEVYNCRCTMIAVLPETEKDIDRRQTYNEWLEGKMSDTATDNPYVIKESKLPPAIYEFHSAQEYREAKQNWNAKYPDIKADAYYVRDANFFEYSNDAEYVDRAKRFDRTVHKLEADYPLSKAHSDRVVIGSFDGVQYELSELQRSHMVTSAQGEFWFVNGTNKTVIAYNPIAQTNTLLDDLKIREEKIAKGERLLTVFDNSPEGTAIHEWGHGYTEYIADEMIYDNPNAVSYWEWYKSLSKEEIAKGISFYATTNREEFEAECFAELLTGNPRPIAVKFGEYLDVCRTDALKRLEKYGEDAIKSGTAGDIEFSQRLARTPDTSSLKTIILPKSEYAHVMSEIATNMTAAEKEMPVVTKAIGKYQYTYENNGFGDYRIIKKVEIDNEIENMWSD